MARRKPITDDPPRIRLRLAAIAMVAAVAICPRLAGAAPVNTAANLPPPDRRALAAQAIEPAARAAFANLSAAEVGLVRGAAYRELRWSGPSSDPDDPSNNVAKADSWSAARTIRASIITWLLTDPVVSKLVHPSGVGIAGARIIGSLDLSYQTTALPITLLDCAIADGVDLSYAHLASIDMRRSAVGAIDAQQAVIQGDVSLRRGRYGDTNFFRSEIDGSIDFSSGHLVGDSPLSMVEATIHGDALFHAGFETAGLLDFRLAKIGQSLSFNDARFVGNGDNGLNAERATIGGALYWVKVALGPRSTLDLGNARAGSLWDDPQSWPAPGNLQLDGFVYGDFSGGPIDADLRLDWLRRQPRSQWAQPQPYRQLAMVLRERGSPEGATRVEIARENAITRDGGLPPGQRLWRLALRVTIGYGYRPLRALWWILLFVVVGTMLFRWGYRVRLITPTEESAYESFVKTGKPPPHYPPFSSFIYSLENFLPVVDLHQGTYWRPNPRHRRAVDDSAREAERGRETIPARILRWYLWLHILAGWTITPLLFAGLSGLLRSD